VAGFDVNFAALDVFASAFRHRGPGAGNVENQVAAIAQQLQTI
jgi:hypothetical protein